MPKKPKFKETFAQQCHRLNDSETEAQLAKQAQKTSIEELRHTIEELKKASMPALLRENAISWLHGQVLRKQMTERP
jgi:hypothetical protein